MFTATVGWFLDNMNRACASMADEELNNVSETLTEEMDKDRPSSSARRVLR